MTPAQSDEAALKLGAKLIRQLADHYRRGNRVRMANDVEELALRLDSVLGRLAVLRQK